MAISDYQGEEIITNIVIKGGKKYEERKYIPRTVFNDPQGKDAYIIGNGESRIGFDLYSLPQDTYGCNALYRDYEPDYLVVVDRKMHKEIVDAGYGENNTVYTNHLNITRNGGVNHLIPHNPHKGAGTTAMHIAIMDGHTHLYCIGFDCDQDGPNANVYKDTPCYNDSKTIVHQTTWGNQIYQMIASHPHIKWTFVGGNQPAKMFDLDNCTRISYNELSTHISKNDEDTQSN